MLLPGLRLHSPANTVDANGDDAWLANTTSSKADSAAVISCDRKIAELEK